MIVGLAAGPAGVASLLGAGRHLGARRPVGGRIDESTTTGVRVVAAVVVLLLVAAALVVLARVGLWQQAFVSDRVIRVLAWALAGFFLLHALVSFAQGWAGSLYEWWLYGPGRARDRTARARRGGLGRSVAHPVATPDAWMIQQRRLNASSREAAWRYSDSAYVSEPLRGLSCERWLWRTCLDDLPGPSPRASVRRAPARCRDLLILRLRLVASHTP